MSADDLPLEIWEQIMSLLKEKELFALLHTSRKLHAITLPQFYRNIHYTSIQPEEYPSIYRRMEQLLPPEAIYLSPSTRTIEMSGGIAIRHLPHFARTILEVPGITPIVKEFRLHVHEKDVETWKHHENEETFSLRIHVPQAHGPVQITQTITSLNIGYPCMPWKQWDDQSLTTLYTLFMIPNLRSIILQRVRNWDGSLILDATRSGTSNVESLSILDAIPMGPVLEDVLMWPRNLLHYHHELRPGWDTSTQYPQTVLISPGNLLEALLPQSDSLKTLYYNNEWDEGENELDRSTFQLLLKNFTKLQKLLTDEEALRLDRASCVLSTSMEFLTVEIDICEAYYEEDISRVNIWLQEILADRAQHLPVLKGIVLWYLKHTQPERESYEEDLLAWLEQIALGGVLKDVGIHLEMGLQLPHSPDNKPYRFVNNTGTSKSCFELHNRAE